jgi:hydrogenase maturation protease
MHLMIGYGNPLRSDDGLGSYLAQTLRYDGEVMICTQLTPELAEPISRVERVVFLDAGIGGTPGEITCEKLAIRPGTGAFTHHVTPALLLAAAQDLYGAAPQAVLITVTGASFDYGCTFSPQIRALLPQIVSQAESVITTYLKAETNV